MTMLPKRLTKFLGSLHQVRTLYAASEPFRINQSDNVVLTKPLPTEAPVDECVVSTMSNGLKLCTYENKSPVSMLSLVALAGSRYDTDEVPGTAHVTQRSFLRNLPGDTSVRMLLLTELRGNTLASYHTREHLVITSSFLRDDLVDAVPLIYHNALNQEFMPHEMLRIRDRLREEYQMYSSDKLFMLTEMLHAVAFRDGLGSPLVAQPQFLSDIKRATVNSFRKRNFVPNRMALVGVGVKHQDLEKVVEHCMGLSSSSKGSSDLKSRETGNSSKYYGGEAHIYLPPSADVDVLMAFPTYSFTDKNYLAAKLAAELLGTRPRISHLYTQNTPYPISACLDSSNVTASSILFQYTDTGLIGFHLHGQSGEIRKACFSLFELMKKLSKSVSESDLNRAKASLIISKDPSRGKNGLLTLSLAKHLISGNQVVPSLKNYSALVNKVTAEEVRKVFELSLRNKISITYAGHPPSVPHASEFCL